MQHSARALSTTSKAPKSPPKCSFCAAHSASHVALRFSPTDSVFLFRSSPPPNALRVAPCPVQAPDRASKVGVAKSYRMARYARVSLRSTECGWRSEVPTRQVVRSSSASTFLSLPTPYGQVGIMLATLVIVKRTERLEQSGLRRLVSTNLRSLCLRVPLRELIQRQRRSTTLALREDALLHKVVLVPGDARKRRLAVESRPHLFHDFLIRQLPLNQIIAAPAANVILQNDLDTIHRHSLVSHLISPVTLDHHRSSIYIIVHCHLFVNHCYTMLQICPLGALRGETGQRFSQARESAAPRGLMV